MAGRAASAPVLASGRLYAATLAGTVHAARADNGRQYYYLQGYGPIWSPPTVHEEDLYFADRYGFVYRVDGKKGTTVWESDVNAEVVAPILITGRFCVAATTTGEIIALNSANGETAWSRDVGAGISAAPSSDGERIFVADWDGRISAFSDAGNPIWKTELDGSCEGAPVYADKMLFAGTSSGTFYCLSAETGDVIRQISLGDPVYSPAAVGDGALYVVTESGTLLRFN
jgi:outer membrane protein assembly factor BamB